MLDRLIRLALQNRLLVVAAAAFLLVYGTYITIHLPIDVLPDLNRPRITIFLEAGGMSPEEVETQVVLPVETELNGLPDVEAVRSNSSIGLGMIYVEFGWNTDIYKARQMISERLPTVELPVGVKPFMSPMSSIMGQIMTISLSADSTSPMELRTVADFVLRRRLMAIKGVSQVITMGGERMQYQAIINTGKMRQFGLTLEQVEQALAATNHNSTGGFFDQYGTEVLIRNIGRIGSLADIENTAVAIKDGQPILLSQVAEVRAAGAFKRGDAGYNARPAVVLTVEKQPHANTVALTEAVEDALDAIKSSLPKDVRIDAKVFQQKQFIENSISNVEEALRDGFILVVIILFLFLLNFRTTFITLTAIPLSIVITSLIFRWFGFSINTLTLGGLAIAIGELVDDAIVDVENVFRRLRENAQSATPAPILRVIFKASSEVRNSIVFATIIVVLVFLPLFWMEGIEGRIFAPLGIAYIISILASLLVSLTVTPVLCSFLLGKIKQNQHHDGFLVRWLKRQDQRMLGWAMGRPYWIIGAATVLIVASFSSLPFFGSEFLPAFNEGSFTINISAPSGTSLEESNRIGTIAEKLIMRVPEVASVSRRTGRAELDEHVEPVSSSEIEVLLHPEQPRSKKEVIKAIRDELKILKGVNVNVGQPISHRIDHLLSGVRAQVAIKIFGNDLSQLRQKANEIKEKINTIAGVVDAQVERQSVVPLLRVQALRPILARYGMNAGELVEDLETLLNGKIVTKAIDGQKSIEVVLRVQPEERTQLALLQQIPLHTPDGRLVPLGQVADISYEMGTNNIAHENAQRRIVVSCNVQGRDLGGTVQEIQETLAAQIQLPTGFFIQYDGQFKNQQSATWTLMLLGSLSILGIFMVLHLHFGSWLMSLQIMLNIPLALIGSVVGVFMTGGVFSVATLVGFITLTGIASRNGIMMISHYIHLVEHEGEVFGRAMIVRGSLERLVPVLMTALVAALALIPLTLDPTAAGKEILYPVAVVILGGLISSTLLDILVTPVVFYVLGEKALKQYFEAKKRREQAVF